MLIGREQEKKELLDALASDYSEFIAVYGRRRVGKTFLIRQYFKNRFAFDMTGVMEGSKAVKNWTWEIYLQITTIDCDFAGTFLYINASNCCFTTT